MQARAVVRDKPMASEDGVRHLGKRATMKILNLGCGAKTCDKEGVTNIDWSIYLRLRKNRILRVAASMVLKGERLKYFSSLPDNIMVHNLARNIPFDSDSVDVVYHSHMLEHLDQDVASEFLREVKRVLRPGGICRIVVPDLEIAVKAYLSHISSCERSPDSAEEHDTYVAGLLEQSVRKEASSTSRQTPLRRRVENMLLGDARRRGETPQWMYDRFNLTYLLKRRLGYSHVHVQNYKTSLIKDWGDYGLDVDDQGNQYKPDSLYVEAMK
ncbi:MAG: methyltransferase domain-containing protein [Nitrospirae bacterium]|nr:methyltransferase domain-containing protein [Nitrospirota bacterium]